MNYVFLDLETTGLDPATCKIVEVGIVITDENFYPIDAFVRVVKTDSVMWEGVHEAVDKMHTDNGLRHQSLTAFAHTLSMVEEAALVFLNSWVWDPGVVLCGNTVHFDRAFMKVHMPLLEKWFHYRNFDVSSIKQLARNIAPDLEFPADNDERHRALPDALMSAQEMGICKRILFEGLRQGYGLIQ